MTVSHWRAQQALMVRRTRRLTDVCPPPHCQDAPGPSRNKADGYKMVTVGHKMQEPPESSERLNALLKADASRPLIQQRKPTWYN